MAPIGLAGLWTLIPLAILILQENWKPENNVLLVPGSNGWVTPALMIDSPSILRPSINNKTIRFFLWTRQNRLVSNEIFIDSPAILEDSFYSSKKPTKILIHGFSQTATSEFVVQASQAYLTAADVNVIVVDWNQLARSPFYPMAATNVEFVGKATGQLVDFLISQGSSLTDFHLLGFSLGAHVAGWAGSAVTTGKLARITGFDPAYPGFEGLNSRRRLSRADATFVDVIHSNARYGNNRAFAIHDPLGHADFYPNGGSFQPGCNFIFLFYQKSCSHRRSSQYFIESIIHPASFRSVRCPSYKEFLQGKCDDCRTSSNGCVTMGEHVSTSASGTYYLETRSSSPFSKD